MGKQKTQEREQTQTMPEAKHETLPATTSGPSTSLTAPEINEAAKLFLQTVEGPRPEPTKLPFIKIDHKEGVFVLPTGEVSPRVSGYPIYYFQTRRWYKRAFDSKAQGKPPDCWSPNLITPSAQSLERQADDCAHCPMSQFGTGRDGKSQACSVQTWLFLLNPEFGSPGVGVVVAPPSSIKALLGSRFQQGYLAKAAAKHKVYEIVWTNLNLARPAADSIHCEIQAEMGACASKQDDVLAIAKTRNELMKAMEELRGQTADSGVGAHD